MSPDQAAPTTLEGYRARHRGHKLRRVESLPEFGIAAIAFTCLKCASGLWIYDSWRCDRSEDLP